RRVRAVEARHHGRRAQGGARSRSEAGSGLMRRARVFTAGRDAPDEVSGADVVVLAADDGGDWAETVRDRAPNAVLVVVGDSPQQICETTLFPRARIIGVSDQAQADEVVDA